MEMGIASFCCVHKALHAPLSRRPPLCKSPHFKLITATRDSHCPEEHRTTQKKQPKKATRKVSGSPKKAQTHGFAALTALRSELLKQTSDIKIASSTGAENEVEKEAQDCGYRMRKDEEKASLPAQISTELGLQIKKAAELSMAAPTILAETDSTSYFSRAHDELIELGSSMLGNDALRGHGRAVDISECKSKQEISLKKSMAHKAGRSYGHGASIKASPETDNNNYSSKALDDSTELGSPMLNGAGKGVVNNEDKGSSILSGQDILIALQKAAFENAKRKKKSRGFTAEKVKKKAQITLPREAVDILDIKPIVVRAEWALQIKKLEKAILELKNDLS